LTKLLHELDLTELFKTNINMSEDSQPVWRALEASAFSMVQEENKLYLVEQSSKQDRKPGIEKDRLTLRYCKGREKPSDSRTIARNAMENTPVAYLVRWAEGQICVSAPNHKDQTPGHGSEYSSNIQTST
jgi:hypothetical protein